MQRQIQLINAVQRILLIWAFEIIGLLIMAWLLAGLSLNGLRAAVVATAVIGLLNAVIWPTLAYYALPVTVFTFGLGALLLNGLMVWLAGRFVPGMVVDSLGTAVWTALGLTAVNTLLSSLLAVDDDASYYNNILRRNIQRHLPPDLTSKRGVIFLEIDGLSEPILRRAIQAGHMPTLARWLENGTHHLIPWETDLSAQTGACQAGILHGNNTNMPAFRWVEKANHNKLMVSTNPFDAPVIEKRHSDGNGLLAGSGRSRTNLFSGDAPQALFTYSRLTDITKFYNTAYYLFFANPYNFTRTLVLFAWDIILEFRARWRQWRQDVQPRLRRKLSFPIIRAFIAVFLRDLTVYTIIGDIFGGQAAAIYATFVGYDEIAHYLGVEDPDALMMLRQLDRQFARLEQASHHAPRPYQFVVLSDHGQSKGASFKQRFGLTLEELVRDLMMRDVEIYSALNSNEGWSHLNMILTDVIQAEKGMTTRAIRQLVRRRLYGESVVLGPERAHVEPKGRSVPHENADIIVLASGNLGLIYFTEWPERLSYEQINEFFPNLILGLVQHDGVGFILVHSVEYGGLVIGPQGVYYLAGDRVEGENPLAQYGTNAADHLRRTDQMAYVADIMVNSFYDPVKDEVAAFEEQIGCHGGLGGNQSRPFLLYPAEWQLENETIIGAEQIYAVLKEQLQQRS